MRYKLIIGGISLFGAGALLGWAFTADIYEQRELESVDRETAEEVKKVRQYLEAQSTQKAPVEQETFETYSGEKLTSEELIEKARKVYNVDYLEDVAVDDVVEEEYVEYSESDVKAMRTHLEDTIAQYTGKGGVELENETDFWVERHHPSEVDNDTPPYVISDGAFFQDKDFQHFDKVEMVYYPEFRLVLDDALEPIEWKTVGRIVGWANLNQFGGVSGDTNTLYVRNHKLGVDYCLEQRVGVPLPDHVMYGMSKDEFDARVAAGLLKVGKEGL